MQGYCASGSLPSNLAASVRTSSTPAYLIVVRHCRHSQASTRQPYTRLSQHLLCYLARPTRGIPLAAATAVALANEYQRDIPFAFNRKEVKDHGEGGQLVGATINGNVVIIDDVITAGTSVRESVDIIRAAGGTPAAVIIALDREEAITQDGRGAIDFVTDEFGLRVHALARFSSLMDFLAGKPELASEFQSLQDYRAHYGSVKTVR